MNFELASPPAHAMIESLRGVGYTIQTAIADIVDNSISAKAANIWVEFRFDGPKSWISIRDDGIGMSKDDLRASMTLGARNPLDQRDADDLGRFGYGLKTASFSQCRNLTVASRKDDGYAVRRWDLDYIARPDVNEWRLLDGAEDHALPALEIPTDTGTVVLWDRLDRLTAGLKVGDRKSETEFLKIVDRVETHLAMVFHRFLEGALPQLRIHVVTNGTSNRVRPWSPFMPHHAATYSFPPEIIKSPDGLHKVALKGFILPHKDQLSEKEYELGAGQHGWASQQGFYVYRNRRMLVGGSWLGLGYPRVWTSEESYKLARISLDFGNGSDSDWHIDIKKSVAQPPYWAAHRVVTLAEMVRDQARKVFAHRGQYGKKAPVVDLTPVWSSVKTQAGTRYRVNRQHPAVQRALSQDGSQGVVEACLRIVEETVPVQRIWLDTVEQGETQKQAFAEEPTAELIEMAQRMYAHFRSSLGFDAYAARQRLLSTEPFQNFPQVIDSLSKEEGQ